MASRASISSMEIPRRLREHAAVNVVARAGGITALLVENWRGPMQDFTETKVTVEAIVVKKVDVTVSKVFKLLLNN